MATEKKIKEEQLHQIWLRQDFQSELFSSDRKKIVVINPGEYNKDSAGPDFKHARIQIGNLTFVGDVEIDSDYSDWKHHGHNINRHYNKVILHVSFTNRQRQNYVYTSDGRKVISISIQDKISADNLKFDVTLAGKKNISKDYSLKCSSEIESVDQEIKRKFVLKLGVDRFQHKCNRIYRRLKELKFLSDLKLNEPVIRYELSKEFDNKDFVHRDFKEKSLWEQLLYELIFEALGYSKNKNIMMKLAQNVNLHFLRTLDLEKNCSTKIESVLFNISGLMPDMLEESNSNYLKQLENYWSEYSTKYDGKKFDETQWQFLGQRPQNFPTVRISGGAKIIESIILRNLTSVLIRKFTEINSTKVLINSIRSLFIIKASGYWKDHYVFEKQSKVKLNYIIGLSRADEIFINILLPFLSVYFDMFGNPSLSKKVLRVYNEYEQRMDNKIVRDVANGIQLVGYNKKTIYSQGMIELYRNYCTKNKCLECEIGKIIFN